jgi:hypothetical protein
MDGLNMKIKTVSLSQSELINILDAIHPNAYDLMQTALEEKAIEESGGEAWLKKWETGRWEVKLNLTYEE